MKIKHLILGIGLGAAILGGCNDDLGLVGPSIQPPEDRIPVYNDTFHIEVSTVLMDGVYAKTDTALLGEIYDPLYGNLKSDYMCQFYCPDNYQFKYKPIEGRIDSVDFQIYYESSVGDTLVPMRAEIFRLTSPLKKDYYTNFDPAEYCDMQQSMGMRTYTAYNEKATDVEKANPRVTIPVPREFGQNFYDETINRPETFKNQATFNQFFPGLYVTTTFGTGNVLNVRSSYLNIYYNYYIKGSTGQDSAVVGRESFNVTQEVIQLSRFKNTDMGPLLQPNENEAYIKSPAGVCLKITLPMKEIAPIVKGRVLNNLPLTLKAYPQADWKYAFQPIPYLMILPEDSVKSFFENGKVNDNITSFTSAWFGTKVSQAYTFGNLSKLVEYQIENAPDKDVSLLAIPVYVTATQNSYTGVSITTAVNNYMVPAGVKVRKDKESRQIVVTSADYSLSE